MELREVLENYNPHWFSESKMPGIPRSCYLQRLEKELDNDQITLLIGLRRIGKTTLLKQFISLLQSKVEIEGQKIIYLSMDHPVIQKYGLGDIIRECRKINELSRNDRLYVFLDELLYAPGIFQWLKVVHDSENVKIYGTSSCSLSLKDRQAFLTGRHTTIRVKPLSFSEYLKFRGKDTNEPHLLERYFEEYLRDGGIPQYVLTRDISYLTTLAEDIIMRDVVARQKVSNPMKIKELLMLLMSRVGKPFTYSKLAKILGVKQETVEQYLSYLTSSELLHVVYRWSNSLNEKIYSPKKIYLGDVGFRYALSGKFSTGSNFENLVFLNILEKEPSYYIKEGVELDFITRTKEVFECKLRDDVAPEQLKLLDRLRKKGYTIHIMRGYRDFL